jgi:hypothetical protein
MRVKEKIRKWKTHFKQVVAGLIDLEIEFRCIMFKLKVWQPEQMRMKLMYKD